MIVTHNLGFPRVGAKRELKFAQEGYWRGEITREQLEAVARQLRKAHWQLQADAGMTWLPVGDFAWYDQVLSLSAMLGNIPARHRNQDDDVPVNMDTLFRMARGKAPTGGEAPACEMTKWFDTNYHYIVPEFTLAQSFQLSYHQLFDEVEEALNLGHKVKAVLLGPLSYLWLGKIKGVVFDKLDLLPELIPAYVSILKRLQELGLCWVQLDEPIFSLDLPTAWLQSFEAAYHKMQIPGLRVLLASYFGDLGNNLTTVINLPVCGLHIDAVRAPQQLATIVDRLSAHKVLSVGIVNGRNVWRTDLDKALALLSPAREKLADRLWLAPSCSLLHVPVDLQAETKLDWEIKQWLAFAVQKLEEVNALAQALQGNCSSKLERLFTDSRLAAASRQSSTRIHNPDVQKRLAAITPAQLKRQRPFPQRIVKQQRRFNFPVLPTTTIGSFPQTDKIRRARKKFKGGKLSSIEYQTILQAEIAATIKCQEKLGLDLLVHGEPERNDMVEYFGEQLQGFAFTECAWVQSYGSRCVKPPIVFGDVSRPVPMTTEWIRYAQSLTKKPVKGMLTGPVTMLSWSFVRDDQPRSVTAQQLALAIRDEVRDLERDGISIIQIDEPAMREGMPLRIKGREDYLRWVVKSFRLASCGVDDETQIHTHMCYSDFDEIISAIADLDADVVTLEASRSQMELLSTFEAFKYPNDIGPGVYDIHSPNQPSVTWMIDLIEAAARYIPVERLWVNPDCGLKTRSWEEVKGALKNMVKAAKQLRVSLVRP